MECSLMASGFVTQSPELLTCHVLNGIRDAMSSLASGFVTLSLYLLPTIS
jgi:hypothetical protein